MRKKKKFNDGKLWQLQLNVTSGLFTQCSQECGGGVQYRRVSCVRGKDLADCDNNTMLHFFESCNTGPCGKGNMD